MKVLFVLMLSLLSIKSCDANINGFGSGIKGNKKIVSKEISIKDYQAIKNTTSADVIYEQKVSAKPYLRIEVDENLIEYVECVVRGNTLEIATKKGSNISFSSFKVYTNSSILKDVKITGSGDMLIKKALSVDDLTLSTSGSGDCKAENVQCDNLKIEITGSGDINISGRANQASISVSGSGDMSAFGMEVKEATCRVSGSGDLSLYVTKSLTAKVSGSGDIEYKGSPEYVDKSVSGSGDVIAR